MPRIFDDIPRPDIRVRRPRKEQQISTSLRILLNGGKRKSARSSAPLRYPQRVIVKAKYVRTTRSTAKALAHLEYIVREGAGRDGQRPEAYGASREDMMPGKGETQFRFIISPESQSASLRELVLHTVRVIEQETGQRLYWQAAEHYNTKQQHAHLVIRGVDRDGEPVSFRPAFLKRGLREGLARYLTLLLGPRPRTPATERLALCVDAPRFTKLDKAIETISRGGRVSLAALDFLPVLYQEPVRRRMGHLASMGLASYRETLGYTLAERWDTTLRTASRHQSFLEGARTLVYTPPAKYQLLPSEHPPLTGYVSSVLRASELDEEGTAVVIESLEGAFYVPLARPIAGLARGMVVTLSSAADRGAQSPGAGSSRLRVVARREGGLVVATHNAPAGQADGQADFPALKITKPLDLSIAPPEVLNKLRSELALRGEPQGWSMDRPLDWFAAKQERMDAVIASGYDALEQTDTPERGGGGVWLIPAGVPTLPAAAAAPGGTRRPSPSGRQNPHVSLADAQERRRILNELRNSRETGL